MSSATTYTVSVAGRDVEAVFITDTATAVAYLARFVEANERYEDFKLGLDTETDSSKPVYTIANPGPLRTIQVAAKATLEDGSDYTRALVIDMRDVDAKQLAPLLRKLPVYLWNVDFDFRVLARDGIWLSDVRDLLYTDLLLRNGKTGARYRGLAHVARLLLGENLDGKGSVQLSYDSTNDLTDDQIIYAAKDAIVTVDLVDPLLERITEEGMEVTNDLEWRASRARMTMQLRGFGFDLDRYTEALVEVERKKGEALTRMARYCGRGQGQLDLNGTGTSTLHPPFNPDSPTQVMSALNTYCAEDLKAFFEWHDPVFLPSWAQKRAGSNRKLGDFESADSQTLTLVVNHTGNELVQALLDYRKNSQILKNFSDATFAQFSKTDPTTGRSRVHGEFVQLGTETGRWSSRNPNMQNFPKFVKPFYTPDAGKVIVQADYSSAEIALVAFLADDESMAEPFHLKRLKLRAEELNTGGLTGEEPEAAFVNLAKELIRSGVDLGKYAGLDAEALAERVKAAYGPASDPHSSTAIKMFGTADGDFRKAAKGVNFGINYGQGARALALGLTERGTMTTPDQAQDHLNRHAKAHPGLAAYLKARDAQIDRLASQPEACDWSATFKLWKLHRDINNAKRDLDGLGHKPGPSDYADALLTRLRTGQNVRTFELEPDADDDHVAALHAEIVEMVEWALSFDGASVLRALTDEEVEAGKTLPTEAVEFFSTTISGRKRYYQLATTSVLKSLAASLGGGKPGTGRAELREQFAHEHGLTLSKRGRGGVVMPLSKSQLQKALSDKDVLYAFVEYVLKGASANVQQTMLYEAYADVLRGHRNRFRNHAVQGGVGDIVEAALADIEEMLEGFPGAWLVCTVHDSIIVEAPEEYAFEISERMQALMVDAFERFAPTVPCSVDADICHTYDERDAFLEEELAELAKVQTPPPAGGWDPAAVPIAA